MPFKQPNMAFGISPTISTQCCGKNWDTDASWQYFFHDSVIFNLQVMFKLT